MGKIRAALAVEFVRKLPGGSQSILVVADDGFPYAVKFADNAQGPNVCFNSAVGTEIFRRVGLPVPEWRLIEVSEAFLERNPGAWVQTESGRRKPEGGWCFGSRHLGAHGGLLLEILPKRWFAHVLNRRDFAKAWLLDAICEHADARQAIFAKGSGRVLKAYFIDHGHLFGGTYGIGFPPLGGCAYLDLAVYAKAQSVLADEVELALRSLDAGALRELAAQLPGEWVTPTAAERLGCFFGRIANRSELKRVLHLLLGLLNCMVAAHDGNRGESAGCLDGSGMRAEIFPIVFPARPRGRSADSGCGEAAVSRAALRAHKSAGASARLGLELHR